MSKDRAAVQRSLNGRYQNISCLSPKIRTFLASRHGLIEKSMIYFMKKLSVLVGRNMLGGKANLENNMSSLVEAVVLDSASRVHDYGARQRKQGFLFHVGYRSVFHSPFIMN